MPKGCRLVTAIGLSPSNKYVAASDAAEKITVYLFDVAGKETKIADCQINMKVVHLAFSPQNEMLFATAGKDHMALCTYDGAKAIKMTKGSSSGNIQSQCSISFSTNPNFKDTCFTGGSDGLIYQWSGNTVAQTYENNKGSVHSVACRMDSSIGHEVVLVGGNDKTLTVYKFDGNLTKMWQVDAGAAPRSCDLFNGNILLGLKNGSILELPWSADGSSQPNVILTSHCDGEVWGLFLVELEDGSMRLLTSGDDNRILAFDPKKHRALAEGIVGEPSKKKKKAGGYKGGASSMSS